MTMIDAFDMGWEAAEKDHDECSNPFDRNTNRADYLYWQRGFRAYHDYHYDIGR